MNNILDDVYDVIIVDDHTLFLEGLVEILESSGHFKIIQRFSNGKGVLDYLGNYPPDLIILDVQMPKPNGVQIAQAIRSKFPSQKIVLLTMYEEENTLEFCLKFNINGLMLKTINKNDIIQSLLNVLNGENIMPSKLSSYQNSTIDLIISQSWVELYNLNEREVIICSYILKGMTTQEISGNIFISETKVEYHKRNIFSKLSVNSIKNLIIKLNESM